MKTGWTLTRRSNGIFMADFVGPDGRRRRVSTGQRERQAAEVKAREIYLDAYAPAPAKPAQSTGSLTVAEGFARMFRREWGGVRSARAILSDTEIVSREIGDLPVEAVTYSVVERLVDTFRRRGH